MSKTNPSQEVETSAGLAREAVLTVLVTKIRTVDSTTTKYLGSGTGFVIKSHGGGSIVLTANHVVHDVQPGDGLYVRRRLPNGVQQLTAHVLHQHKFSDVAVLRVPKLRNVLSLTFEPNFLNGDSVIGVGYANPVNLFPGIDVAYKCIPDLSPGNIIATDNAGTYMDVDVSYLQMEMVSVSGMSGSPILKATGVVGMIVAGDGPSNISTSYNTILQVLKIYLKIRLRRATPSITDVDMDARVSPMTMEQRVNFFQRDRLIGWYNIAVIIPKDIYNVSLETPLKNLVRFLINEQRYESNSSTWNSEG